MNAKEVTVRFARKVNLGNYNMADVEVAMVISVDETEDPELAINWGMALAKNKVLENCRGVVAEQTQKPAKK
jgi:hypothetical protein